MRSQELRSSACQAGRCDVDEGEPQPPTSFVFNEDIPNDAVDANMSSTSFSRPRLLTRSLSATDTGHRNHQGSQDSGFFGLEAISRRRPADEDVEFGFAIFFKRNRQDRS